MKSVAQKLQQLEGMLDTKDLTDWQNRFLYSTLQRHRDGQQLSEKQLEIIDELYERHFA